MPSLDDLVVQLHLLTGEEAPFGDRFLKEVRARSAKKWQKRRALAATSLLRMQVT